MQHFISNLLFWMGLKIIGGCSKKVKLTEPHACGVNKDFKKGVDLYCFHPDATAAMWKSYCCVCLLSPNVTRWTSNFTEGRDLGRETDQRLKPQSKVALGRKTQISAQLTAWRSKTSHRALRTTLALPSGEETNPDWLHWRVTNQQNAHLLVRH